MLWPLYFLFAGFIDALEFGLTSAIIGMVGASTALVGTPIGFAIAIIIDTCLSLTFGVALMTIMLLCGNLDLGSGAGFLIFKLIPGLDIMPGFTGMVGMSYLRKQAEQGSSILSKLTQTALAARGLGKSSGTLTKANHPAPPRAPSPRAPVNTRPAANDNHHVPLVSIDGIKKAS